MGFFSGGGPNVKGLLSGLNNAMPGLYAARAIADGDYATAARLHMMQQQGREEQEKERSKADLLGKVRAGMKARGYKDTDIDVMMADPSTAAALVKEALVTREGGAEGMTLRHVDPATGAVRNEATPGWHNGDYFGGTDGTKAPERLYQGEKVFPVEKGGYLGVYGGPAGQTVPQQTTAPTAGATPTVFQPGQVVNGYRFKGGDDTDPANWEKTTGGAGLSQAPRFFP